MKVKIVVCEGQKQLNVGSFLWFKVVDLIGSSPPCGKDILIPVLLIKMKFTKIKKLAQNLSVRACSIHRAHIF